MPSYSGRNDDMADMMLLATLGSAIKKGHGRLSSSLSSSTGIATMHQELKGFLDAAHNVR